MNGEEIFLQRKNKFLAIGRNKGFTKSSETENNLILEKSILEKIKNKINKNKKTYYILISILAISILLGLLL